MQFVFAAAQDGLSHREVPEFEVAPIAARVVAGIGEPMEAQWFAILENFPNRLGPHISVEKENLKVGNRRGVGEAGGENQEMSEPGHCVSLCQIERTARGEPLAVSMLMTLPTAFTSHPGAGAIGVEFFLPNG